MKYINIPLLVLLLSAVYLWVIYLGLALAKRMGIMRRKAKTINSRNSIPPA